MKKQMSIRSRMYRVIGITAVLMALLLVATVILLQSHNNQYRSALHNITTASEFNQEFKNNIDQLMYYYVVESQYSVGLPVEDVRQAQMLADELLRSTTDKQGYQAISSVQELCRTLETKIYQIQDTADFDERILQLENNVYVLTSLIEEYMYSYLYHEAVNLNALQNQLRLQSITEIIVVVVLSALLMAVSLRAIFRLSNSITAPLETLCQRAEEVSSGNLTARDPIETDAYEIRMLSEGMEEMIARLEQQIREIGTKQESLRKTELALLQAQINPHFLYNTMDTIIWLIEAKKTDEAVEMVSNLSSFFRHSLSKGRDIITLAEEEQHVRSYLEIQHFRYKDILEYEVEIAPELKQLELPKLTLQPLVENALYHGIKLKREGGRIEIRGRREDATAVLTVEDNGAGMNPQQLEQLRNTIRDTEKVGFGYPAVNQRLQLQFGTEYGLTVESVEGEGTRVQICIPMPEDSEPPKE